MTLRRTALAVAACALVVVACDSRADDTGDATSTPPSSGPTSSAVTTSAPATTVPASTTPTTAAPDYSEWCAVAERVDELSDRSDLVDYTDPDEVEAYLEVLVPALESATEQAPDEIADAVATSADIAAQLRDALADAGYDMLVADLSLVDELDDERSAAQDEIRRFNAEQCGIAYEDDEPTDETGDDDFSFSDGSLRDQFIGNLVDNGFTLPEAACIFQELDFADTDSMNDPDVLGPVFDACGITVERLEEIGAATDPELASTDLLATSLAAAGLDEEQIACVTGRVEAMSVSELDEDAVIGIMLDCGVGIEQMFEQDLSGAGDLEDAYVDQFEAMGMSRTQAECLYDELIVGNIDGFSADDVLAAMDVCGVDPDAVG